MRPNPLSRRAVLRALGASVALPWLESPAIFANEPVSATPPVPAGPPRRFACLFFGDGIAPSEWTFSGADGGITLGKALEPLAALKRKLLFINGLKHDGGVLAGHSKGAAGMLCGVPPRKGTSISCGVSMDQVLAHEIGERTPLPSLVLACERPISGFHESQYSMVYASHLSWNTPTSPVPSEMYPSLAFDSLFGSAGNRAQRSVLDCIGEQYQDLTARVSHADRSRLDEYATSVREIEKRMARIAADAGAGTTAGAVRPPAALPGTVDEHSRLMLDVLALAFQTDRTRIATTILANDLSGQVYPFLGIRDDHHSYSHSNESEPYRKIVRFWVGQYAYLLAKLDAMQEGEGTVLDHSCIMLCNEHWIFHDARKIPLVVGGGLGGAWKTGRCLDFEKAPERRMSSLLLDVAAGMGVMLPAFADGQQRLGI